jgi:hypothetical protein
MTEELKTLLDQLESALVCVEKSFCAVTYSYPEINPPEAKTIMKTQMGNIIAGANDRLLVAVKRLHALHTNCDLP